MSKIICNIPHSGTQIPEWARKDILVPEWEFRELMDFMTDVAVDELWDFVPQENMVVAGLSRLILDTERFRDDRDEPMAKLGMGLYYTHTPAGKEFRRKSSDTYAICLSLYDAYHRELEEKVTACLSQHGTCIVLDCHSFHDKMDYTGYDPKEYPDVCVGINGRLSAEAGSVVELLSSAGYSVKINEPFSGALVPLKYLKDPRVTSIMIELNRRIYHNSSFPVVHRLCRKIYEMLE